jgi:hypothetical protein
MKITGHMTSGECAAAFPPALQTIAQVLRHGREAAGIDKDTDLAGWVDAMAQALTASLTPPERSTRMLPELPIDPAGLCLAIAPTDSPTYCGRRQGHDPPHVPMLVMANHYEHNRQPIHYAGEHDGWRSRLSRYDTCKAPRCWGEYGTPCDRCPMPARTPEQIRRECIAPAECFCGACGEPAAIDSKIPEQCYACDCYLPCEALAAWVEDEIVP